MPVPPCTATKEPVATPDEGPNSHNPIPIALPILTHYSMEVLNHFYTDFRAVHRLLRMHWRVDLTRRLEDVSMLEQLLLPLRFALQLMRIVLLRGVA